MIYKFHAYGHQNILATHKTTLEFTKDSELTLNGDCIVGVKADFDLNKIRKFIKKIKNRKITITIEAINKKVHEKITAEVNPSFNSNKELVIRKTDFLSERTFAMKANKAAFEMKRELVNALKEKGTEISIIMNFS